MYELALIILVLTIFRSAALAQISTQFGELKKDAQLESLHHKCKAVDFEDQIGNGKWRKYDIVLDNCLVWHFIESTKMDINFYALLEKQKSLTTHLLDYHRDTGRHSQSVYEKGNKIKSELALKASRRQSNRLILKLKKLNEESQLNVALMEVEVRELMDKCNLFWLQREKQSGHITECATMKDQTLDRVKQACDRLRGQNAILMAMMLIVR